MATFIATFRFLLLFLPVLYTNQYHQHSSNLLDFFQNHNVICQNYIFVQQVPVSDQTAPFHRIELPYVINNVSPDAVPVNTSTSDDLEAFFRRERLDAELETPVVFRAFKHSQQCGFAIFQNYSTIQTLVLASLQSRTVMPTRDYFVIVANSNVTPQFPSNWTFLERLQNWLLVSNSQSDNTFLTSTKCSPKLSPHLTPAITTSTFCSRNIAGKDLKVGTVNGDQFIHFRNNPDGTVKSAGGIYFYMIRDLSERYNFTFRLFKDPTGSGMRSREGKWNGVVGGLVSGFYDLTFPTAINVARNRVVDYTNLVAWFDRMFWVQTPPAGVSSWALAQPFTWKIWILVGLATLMSSATFYLILVQDNKGLLEKHDTGVHFLVEITVRVVLEQSFAVRGKWKGRLRLLFALWIWITLILSTAYRSKLFFFLTFLTSAHVPETHQELSVANYKIIFRSYGGAALSFWKNSKDPVHRKLLAKTHFNLVPTTPECILGAAQDEKAACLDYDFSGKYAIAANTTLRLDTTGKALELLKPSIDIDSARAMIIWALPKGSTIQVVFKDAILWHHASGMYLKWIDLDWTQQKVRSVRWLKQTKTPVSEKLIQVEHRLHSGVKPLKMMNLAVPFIIQVFASVIAIFVLVAEKFVKAMVRRKELQREAAAEHVVRVSMSPIRSHYWSTQF